MATPTPTKRDHTKALEHERRRQLRGLMLLAFAVLAFCILRAGISHVFLAGWWRLW
ncbi:MAG TPA: hypothetical protein VGB69_08165 [Edaphobacter sp.]